MKLFIFSFQKFNEYGYDKLNIIAFHLDQAKTIIKDLVIDPDDWNFFKML